MGLHVELDDAADVLTDSRAIASQKMTSPNTASTVKATRVGQIWTVSAFSEGVWYDIAGTPDATSGTSRRYCPENAQRQHFVQAVGETVAYATS